MTMQYNIVDYGSVAGGSALCTEAIQAAIDDCAASGGGQVVIPPGKYLCGGLHLRSRVSLFLCQGAVLAASPNPEDYRCTHLQGTTLYLLFAQDAQDLSVCGSGEVLGTGEADFGSWWGIHEEPAFRIGLMLAHRCENIRVQDVTFRYSDAWTLHFLLCRDVWVRGVRILNNIYHLNSDGIDPDSCSNVMISDCYICAGDDCICPKTSVENAPMENLVVTNCVLESTSTAIKLGTGSLSDFTDIHVSNCVIRNSSVGIGIFVKDGATVQRVSFSNISIECADREHIKPVIPLYIDIEKRDADSRIGRVRDVSFSHIQIDSASGALFQGVPESPIENLSLSHVVFRAKKACDLSRRFKSLGGSRSMPDDGRDTRFIRENAYFCFAHTRQLALDQITVVQQDEAAAQDMNPLYLHDCADAQVDRVRHIR